MMMTESVRNGVFVGIGLALLQSLISTFALKWALKRKFFNWVWFGGILARVVVLVLTAVIASHHREVSLAATLLSLVVATAIFLVIETQMLLTDRK